MDSFEVEIPGYYVIKMKGKEQIVILDSKINVFLYSGYYGNNISAILVAIVSFYYLGSILFSLIPTDASTSWEAHVFGFLAGIFSAHYGCLPLFELMTYYLLNVEIT